MRELEKIRRVIQKRIPAAPHEVLLVLDATTGQNAVQQAKVFTQAAGVTGLVLTKLDGTAKGGAAITIRRELGLPVKYIGVGEGMDDLQPFDPDAFLAGIFGE
jgi:fused signal recognition particle receptor